MQPVKICLFWSKQLEETFEDTQWRKVKQMQPMWLCIFSGSQFEGPSKETQLQFGDNLNIFVNIWMYTISVCVWHKLYQFIEISPRSKIYLTLHSPRDHLKHKSYKNTILVGVGNSDDWCTQNCPPQDCPPRGQLWGSPKWFSENFEIFKKNWNFRKMLRFLEKIEIFENFWYFWKMFEIFGKFWSNASKVTSL